MRIALGVEYAGDVFEGWQSQRHGRTAQDHLEAAIASIAGHPVRLHCAGRTDAGVHATAQVVHFDTAAPRRMNSWVRGVNSCLGHKKLALTVRWAVEVDESFHARFSAMARRYRYILYTAPVRSALLTGRAGWTHWSLDEKRMAEAAVCLVGWHDFSAFRAAACQAKSPLKLMHEVRVQRDGDYIVLDFHANAFLHHMVRNLVGALVYIGKGYYDAAWLAETLLSGDRERAAPTFPADGLYLCGVDYPPHWPLPDGGRIIALPRIPVF